MRYLSCLLLAYCVGAFAVFAQKSKFTIDPALAQKYEGEYPDERALILDSKHTYRFEMKGKKSTEPIVSHRGIDRIISLRSLARVGRFTFYDDNSEILDAYRVNDKNKSLNQDQDCGYYQTEGIFHSDARICNFPLYFQNMGEIQNLIIDKQYNNVRYFATIYFHDPLPVLKKKIVIEVPKEIQIELKEFNFEGFAIQSKVYDSPDRQSKVYEYQIENLSPLNREEDAPGPSHTYPHLLVLPKSYKDDAGDHAIISSLDDLYRWYKSLVGSLNTNPEALQEQVNKLTQGLSRDEDKIKAIYYWIQDNIRYIAFEDGIAGFKPDEAHQVLEKKYGDCKGMANLTKEMLRIAGYDARLTWIGTNHLAYTYDTPSLAVDNHMVCTLLLDGKRYVLDATEKFIALDDNGERIQGRPLLIEDGDNFILDKVPVAKPERNATSYELDMSIEGETLISQEKITLNGEMKTQILNLLNLKQSSEHASMLKKFFQAAVPSSTIRDLKNSSAQVREEAFTVNFVRENPSDLSQFGDEVYVKIDPYPHLINSMTEDDRTIGLDLKRRVASQTRITLQIPEGYTVQRIPENIKLENKNYSFEINYQATDSQIVYEKKLNVFRSRIPKSNLADWNRDLKKLKKFFEDQVVLSRQ